MGKFKKMLAGMLSAAMVMSTMTVSAFAVQTTTPSTIDTTKNGSITIHKYEYNEYNVNDKITGTGSENDKVPDGAKPLEGSGFTIYKVADENDLENITVPIQQHFRQLESTQQRMEKSKLNMRRGRSERKLRQAKMESQNLKILSLDSML